MSRWQRFDNYPAVEWITAEIVRLTCCGVTETLYPGSDGGLVCPTCGKRYRLRVEAYVEVLAPSHTTLACAGTSPTKETT